MSAANTVVLRVRPDGTSILTTTINAAAATQLSMRRYPFDSQRLQAVFEIPGFRSNWANCPAPGCLKEDRGWDVCALAPGTVLRAVRLRQAPQRSGSGAPRRPPGTAGQAPSLPRPHRTARSPVPADTP